MTEEIQTRPFSLDAKQFAWASFPAFLPKLLPLLVGMFVLLSIGMIAITKNVPLSLLYVFVITVGSTFMHPWRSAKTLKKPAYRHILAERTNIISPTHFEVKGRNGEEGKIPLASFCRAWFSNGMYLLELQPRQFYAIPATAFYSEDHRAKFVEWVKAAVPRVKGF